MLLIASILWIVMNYELRIMNYELWITKYELWIVNHELWTTNYEVWSMNYKVGLSSPLFLFQRLINMKKYDKKLYENVDELFV